MFSLALFKNSLIDKNALPGQAGSSVWMRGKYTTFRKRENCSENHNCIMPPFAKFRNTSNTVIRIIATLDALEPAVIDTGISIRDF